MIVKTLIFLTTFILFAGQTYAAEISPGSGLSTSYTCTDDPLNTRKGPACKCIGKKDCDRMADGGVCKTNTTRCQGTSCWCDWKKASRIIGTTSRPNFDTMSKNKNAPIKSTDTTSAKPTKKLNLNQSTQKKKISKQKKAKSWRKKHKKNKSWR